MIMRVLQVLMAALFVMAAAVQYNDPDPLIWILIYSGSALLCLLTAARQPTPRALRVVKLGIASVASVWSAWLASGVLGQQPIFDEEGREMMGLALIALWLGGSALWAWRQAQKASDASVTAAPKEER